MFTVITLTVLCFGAARACVTWVKALAAVVSIYVNCAVLQSFRLALSAISSRIAPNIQPLFSGSAPK